MIRVTLMLRSANGAHRDKRLGVATIFNDGTASDGTCDSSRGNYRYAVSGVHRIIRRGEVKDFPRRRLLAWDLLCRVLDDAFGARNRPALPRAPLPRQKGGAHRVKTKVGPRKAKHKGRQRREEGE